LVNATEFMLLTLCTGSLRSKLGANGGMSLLDVPEFTVRHLQLRGLNIPAEMLAGWTLNQIDELRDRADKAACPCLVLVEERALELGHVDEARRDMAANRLERLAIAANRLGCNALAVRIEAADTDDDLDRVATHLKEIMPAIERRELNVLISPWRGLTHVPTRLTALIKRIGGFRIGSLPTFGAAAETGDVLEALRKLSPYAGAIHATVGAVKKKDGNEGYDLGKCVKAMRSVGFSNTIAIDFVGKGDPVQAIEQARAVLQSAIDAGE
jgi:sugar phosphate isomerase/epimerase